MKIAVILPLDYRGGTLRNGLLVAEAILHGARQSGEECQVIFGYLDLKCYTRDCFGGIDSEIQLRPFKWKKMDKKASRLAMIYANNDPNLITDDTYMVPDDGMNNFQDCDLIVFISDRLVEKILPCYQYVCMVSDYIQRHYEFIAPTLTERFIEVAHEAQRIFVTTEFTYNDAINYVGLPASKIVKLPMLVPDFTKDPPIETCAESKKYFVWTTNVRAHKNHLKTVKALIEYYEDGGRLDCVVTGSNAGRLLTGADPHLVDICELLSSNEYAKKHIHIRGDLTDSVYKKVLSKSAFLIHTAIIDNGTFSVCEAAVYGVPSLSTDYPPMREIDENFKLNLLFADRDDSSDIAQKIKIMEKTHLERAKYLPAQSDQQFGPTHHGLQYWGAVKECL